jgi:hypothetical protein
MLGLKPTPVLLALAVVMGCSGAPQDANVYSLWRNSVLDATARYHIATFDADDGAAYNWENCDQARSLFQAQPGVTTRFWCQPGRAP